MLKQGTFINKKFDRLLLGLLWGWIGYTINLMTDSLISSNQLGEVSLEAVSIVFPLYSVAYFFSYLIAPGTGILFGKFIGEFNSDEASRVAGTSLISSVLVCGLAALGLYIIKEPFLAYYECTGQLLQETRAYYNWLLLYLMISSVGTPVYYLAISDAESVLISVGGLGEIVINVALSLVLSEKYGISGLGLATCLGAMFCALSYSAHMLRKTSNVKPRFCLDLHYVKRSIVLSFSDYMYYLFLAIVDIVLNSIIIKTCGMEFIPAYSVVNLIFGVCETFGALNDSGIGFITCFLGERNNHDMNLVFKKMYSSTVIMSIVICAVFFLGAPLMPVIYGLETPEVIRSSIMTSRIMSFTALGFGFSYIIGSMSADVERPMLACFLSFLNDVFSPLLLSAVFGYLWGFTGIVIGMSLSPYFALILYSAIMIPISGKKGFPAYAEDFKEEGVSYDLYAEPQSIAQVSENICAQLNSHGFNIKNVDLLIDEFFTRLIEKNPGNKVLCTCTLLFKDNQARIIIRDDGVLYNFIDENNAVESLNAHVLNSLLEKTKNKNYLITTSFNRNGFVFEK